MDQRLVTFYGTVCKEGFVLSKLLIERRITHDFVLMDGFLLHIQDVRHIDGFDRIRQYLERYEYFVDLWI